MLFKEELIKAVVSRLRGEQIGGDEELVIWDMICTCYDETINYNMEQELVGILEESLRRHYYACSRLYFRKMKTSTIISSQISPRGRLCVIDAGNNRNRLCILSLRTLPCSGKFEHSSSVEMFSLHSHLLWSSLASWCTSQ